MSRTRRPAASYTYVVLVVPSVALRNRLPKSNSYVVLFLLLTLPCTSYANAVVAAPVVQDVFHGERIIVSRLVPSS